MTKHLTNEDRQRAIDAYLRGQSLAQIAAFLGCSKSAIRKIVMIYNSEGRVAKMNEGGMRRKSLNDEEKLLIVDYMQQDCAITLKEIKEKLYQEKNKVVCIKTIDRAISSFNWSLKSIHLIPERRNDLDVVEQRFNYASQFFSLIMENNGNNLIFVDEVGFNLVMRSRRGRSPIGTRASMTVPGIRSQNISCCAAMSRNGVICFETQTRAYNSDSFLNFIIILIEKLQSNNISNAYIIMDNVPFHKVTLVKEKIESNGHNLIFLPPYSPFLNPIENAFSKWKQLVRRSNSTNYNELISNINAAYLLISQNDCEGFYRHMLSFLQPCIRSEPILNG